MRAQTGTHLGPLILREVYAVTVTLAAIFLYGGELNGTVIAAKRRRLHKLADARHVENVLNAPP